LYDVLVEYTLNDNSLKEILKFRLDLARISIEKSVMVSGIVYVFLGFVVLIGHVQLSLLIMGVPLGY